MKIRQGIMVVCAVALLTGYYYLGTDYLRQRRESVETSFRIVAVLETLGRLPPSDEVAPRLEEARRELSAARELIPEPASATLIIDEILEIARADGVTVIPLVTQPWLPETVADAEIKVFRLSVTVSGSYDALEGFLDDLVSRGPETLVIEDIRVGRIRGDGGEPVAGGIFAGLQLAVYARSPGSD